MEKKIPSKMKRIIRGPPLGLKKLGENVGPTEGTNHITCCRALKQTIEKERGFARRFTWGSGCTRNGNTPGGGGGTI